MKPADELRSPKTLTVHNRRRIARVLDDAENALALAAADSKKWAELGRPGFADFETVAASLRALAKLRGKT
jgi:hypothetical protein